jgi:DNA (cytosine-5)-methyltransferase 1
MFLAPEDRVVLNLFAGPGGVEVGARAAGWWSTDAVEIDCHACATLRSNFPDLLVHSGDIRSILVRQYSRRYFPVAVYTFPCDHYSAYGAIHGVQTGDDLYLHALRNHVLLFPEVCLIENVLGMREKFPVVMELFRNLPFYYCTEFVVYGHDFTLMRKPRLFLLLHRQPFVFPSLDGFVSQHPIPLAVPLLWPGQVLDDYLEDPDKMDALSQADTTLTSYLETRIQGGYQRPAKLYDPAQAWPINLPTNYKRDRSVALVKDPRSRYGYRPFSHREIARLHGFPDTHTFCGGKNARFAQTVDSVMPPVAYAFFWLLNQYFDAIDELMPQPQPLGHRFVSSAHRGRMGRLPLSGYSNASGTRLFLTSPFPSSLAA